MDLLIFVVLMSVFIWGFLILPQQRRTKRHNELIASLQVGDDVMTSSGIYGKISDQVDDDFFIEIAPDVEVRIAAAAIVTKVEYEDDEG